MMLLDEKIVQLARALAGAGVPHAFGGALALAYYAAPRGTHDIDVNVFLPPSEATRVFDAIAPLGVAIDRARARRELRARGQTRLLWDRTPIVLFFAYDALHDRCLERLRRVPFTEGVELPVLSAEDLALFKVLFDRAKDQADVSGMLYALGPDFDVGYALHWLRRILPAEDERLRRFEARVRPPAS